MPFKGRPQPLAGESARPSCLHLFCAPARRGVGYLHVNDDSDSNGDGYDDNKKENDSNDDGDDDDVKTNILTSTPLLPPPPTLKRRIRLPGRLQHRHRDLAEKSQ